MSGRIPDNILEDILSRVDIVEVISGYIPLKRSGRNFKTNCPFHHEKTPSFMVSPDRQIYHCFGCGESGNAFKFLMRYERLDFPEAVQALARKSGVALPQRQETDKAQEGLQAQLYKINELAAIFYEGLLNSPLGKSAREYLIKRGIKQETAKLFKIGYTPDKWDALITHLREKGISLSLLEKAGLVLAKEGGGYYDRFRGRIIFSIFDIKSRVLGFGARVLPSAITTGKQDSLPKYINSPETSLYTKGRHLYGLNLAKDAIRENDCVVVVEGYLDFIMPYQEGLRNIVASLGTALTPEQARVIKRYTHNAVMVYDPDKAGEIATLRSLDIFIEEGMDVKVVSLPQGFDPDSFVRKEGIASLREKINSAENLFDYKLKVLKSRYGYLQIESKAKIASEILPTINKLKNAVLKTEYLKRLAQGLDIKEEALFEELKKVKEDKPYASLVEPATKRVLNINPTEKLLVKMMLEEQGLVNRIRESLEPADFQDQRVSRIVSQMFQMLEEGRDIGVHSLVNYFEDEDISQIICESTFLPPVSDADKEKIIDDCIRRLKQEKNRLKQHELHNQIRLAQHCGNEEKLRSLIEEFHNLIKKG